MTGGEPNDDKTKRPIAKASFAKPQYVWVFQCSNRLALHAATFDRKGRNLPMPLCADGIWRLNGQLIVGPDNNGSVGIDITALKVGIKTDGYYLWNADLEPPPETLRLMK
jgi:hypothetical protein